MKALGPAANRQILQLRLRPACRLALQAGEDPYLHVLSGTGSSVQAAFYNTDADELAARHPAVGALLAAAKKPRNGCYKAATADLVAAADCPPYQVPITETLQLP